MEKIYDYMKVTYPDGVIWFCRWDEKHTCYIKDIISESSIKKINALLAYDNDDLNNGFEKEEITKKEYWKQIYNEQKVEIDKKTNKLILQLLNWYDFKDNIENIIKEDN